MATPTGVNAPFKESWKRRSSACVPRRSPRWAPAEPTPACTREDRPSAYGFPDRWDVQQLRRALMPCCRPTFGSRTAAEMRAEFHARYSAMSRRTATTSARRTKRDSPFRGRYELAFGQPLIGALWMPRPPTSRVITASGASPSSARRQPTTIIAVACRMARWDDRPGGLVFEIEANRFLHHMVRFLVGTMLDVATDRRPLERYRRACSTARDNSDVSPPAPPHALFLDA